MVSSVKGGIEHGRPAPCHESVGDVHDVQQKPNSLKLCMHVTVNRNEVVGTASGSSFIVERSVR